MKPGRHSAVFFQAVRLAVLACVATAIAGRSAPRPQVSLAELPPAVWRAWFPNGVSAEEDGTAARVLDADGQSVGTLLQTSPDGDGVVGFSGPSNVLIGVDSTDHVAGVQIIASGDTAEHVAAVNRSAAFTEEAVGGDLAALTRLPIDGVSGATLTAAAAANAVRLRLGGETYHGVFPDRLTLEDVRAIAPTATAIEPTSQPGVWRVDGGEPTWAVRTSRAGTTVIGYQGPTDGLAVLDAAGRLVAMTMLASRDNEPYVGDVREDLAYLRPLLGLTAAERSAASLYELGIDGVSGATMTSLALADSFAALPAVHPASAKGEPTGPQQQLAALWPTGVFVLASIAVAFTRGRRRLRWVWPVLAVAVLGVWQGDLLSLAMLRGWAVHGLTTSPESWGLLAVAAAAFFVPALSGRNVYCSHLCPHGAAQMLVRGRLPRPRIAPRLRSALRHGPWVLLAVGVGLAIAGRGAALIGMEPFDAWLWPVCGWATVTVAMVGLAASAAEPMAYCQYGCATGALLKWVSRSGAGRWRRRDWAGVATAVAALAMN